ncbi:MAG: hypothetical protein M5U12_22175 [Verrucomicrobia bacterium]|nr:hypothetical protein [Verrucomicrobiota bacterium]
MAAPERAMVPEDQGRGTTSGKVADDPDGQRALEKWLDQRDDLLAGRTPRSKREGVSMADLANKFLTAKTAAVGVGS